VCAVAVAAAAAARNVKGMLILLLGQANYVIFVCMSVTVYMVQWLFISL